MWLSILISAAILNAVMLLVHYAGPKGIVLTWIPGRTLILIFSLLHKPELKDTLIYTWASGIVPVTMLLALNISVRTMKKRRVPRFRCAKNYWIYTWILTILATAAAIALIGLTTSHILHYIFGGLAISLNVFNIMDSPQHLEQDHVQLSFEYVFGVNVVVFGALAAMDALLEAGFFVWAGIVSNVPLLVIILIAKSTCEPTPQAIKMTGQHIYMLSYQTWPNMIFVGIFLASLPLGTEVASVIAGVSTCAVFLIQYIMIKTIL